MRRAQQERQIHERLVRERLVKALGRAVPNGLWNDLRKRKYVQDALEDGPESGFDNLVAEALRELSLAPTLVSKQGRVRLSRNSRNLRGLLTLKESDRAAVFSAHVGRVAAMDLRVVAVRDKVLGGTMLSPSEALAFFESPAPYLLSRQDFAELGVPIVGHIAKSDLKPPPPQSEWSETIHLQLRGGGRSVMRIFELNRCNTGETRLTFPDGLGGGYSKLPVLAGSIAADLLKASQWLHSLYPWEERDALWFIVTGQPPWIPPLQVGVRCCRFKDRFEHMYMDFAIEPWVSAGTVTRVLRACQRELLGRKNSSIPGKNLVVMDFVCERQASSPKEKWPALTEAWNKRHAERRILDYRHLRRAYVKTRRSVLLPGYESSAVAVAVQKLATGKSATRGRKRQGG